MTPDDDAKRRTAEVYNTAADFFDDPALSFWDLFGERTVDRLALRAGARVLDVCCGSGASALPAAGRVGPAGRVHALDLAGNLLALGRAKAARRGLDNITFEIGDMERTGFPDGSFDAVVCVFGIFFLPDMAAGVRELWRMVGPGGRLAITTWGADVFEPATTLFWDAVRAERPDLYKAFNAWDRISDPDALRNLLRDGGVGRANVLYAVAER